MFFIFLTFRLGVLRLYGGYCVALPLCVTVDTSGDFNVQR